MLVELVIENYAVVERLRVRFHRGLNLLTGETGSGKSIVVDALGLLLGGRASAEAVRSGSERARISGLFEVPADARFRQIVEAAGIGIEEDELLVEREILANGKSRAFLANRMVTASLLRDLAPLLGDIHGQHEQQELFSAIAQRGMLDAYAGNEAALAETSRIYKLWRACSTELEELTRREQEQLRLADLWSFQRKEIESAEVKSGEDAGLANEKRVLQNAAKLTEAAESAYTSLYDAPESALARVQTSLRKLQDLTRIDEHLGAIAETLRPAELAVEEASQMLREYLGKLEADPKRQDEVESRLAVLEKLKRKYGHTLEEVMAFLDDVRQKMSIVETASERRAEIEKKQAKLGLEFESAANKLTGRRKDAAKKLQTKVESELASLAMERTQFHIELKPAPWSEGGADALLFLFSANQGEEPKPLEKVASGGEVSRIALALKTCVQSATMSSAKIPMTLVFDEVDAGIGGVAAEMVGRRLKQLSASSQVLCVTHQAQIAGFADHHYRVEKKESKGRTIAVVDELDAEERTREIGRMLSGQRLTPEALKHAEQLIKASS
jgi:DNA repair protein RecN (Recombination protein N)